MHRPAGPAISFCTACKNRLWQLRQTLPANLAVLAPHADCELVLVDYDSNDELEDWVRAFLAARPGSRLRFAKLLERRDWHTSIGKNLAHRLGRGRWLVNLDADNFIGDQIALLRHIWTAHGDAALHLSSGSWPDGTEGRIGLPRTRFQRLGGYDESFLPSGYQDLDLLRRARWSGVPVLSLPEPGSRALTNTLDEKMRFIEPALRRRWSWMEMNASNARASRKNVQSGRLRANPAGHAPARLRLGFDGPQLTLL